MTDVLPQMRHFLRNGPVTKTVDTSCKLPTRRTIYVNAITDPSKDIRALLSQMDAIIRHHRSSAALADFNTDDFPIPGTARISQSWWHSTWSRSEPLLRCLHGDADGANCSSAGVLDDVRDFALVECGVLPSGLRGGLVDA